MKTQTSFCCDQREVIGHLHGYDRLRLQGTLPPLYNAEIMHQYLWQTQVLHKDFKAYTKKITDGMRTEIEAAALRRERPVIYLATSGGKEERARQLAEAQGITEGVICVFSARETGRTYEAWPNRQTRKLEMRLRAKPCVHLYVYLLHAVLGFMYIRFQTWFPFLVQ